MPVSTVLAKRRFVSSGVADVVMSQKELDKLVNSLAKEDEEPDLHLENVKDVFK